jgi:polar amino acid transport system substrate-binding protein
MTRLGSGFLCGLYGLSLLAQAVEPDKLLHVVGDHAPPFRIVVQGNCSGIYCDVMQALAKRSGYRLKFSEVPPKRALMMMEQGQADLMLGPNRSSEREQFMHYLHASFPPANKAFYVRPGGPNIQRYEDLDGLLVSVEAGKKFFDQFDADTRMRRDLCNDSLTALRKVAAARSDVALLPEQEGDWLLRREGLALQKASWVVAGKPSYIAFSRHSAQQDAIPALEAAFLAMQADGSLQAILARYR